MRLSAPTKIVWYISLILGLAGIVLHFMNVLPAYNLWMVFVAWILLILGTLLKGF